MSIRNLLGAAHGSLQHQDTQDIQIILAKSLLKFAEPYGSHREPIQADQPEEADQPQGSERAQAQSDREQIMFRNPVSSVIC